MCQLYCCLTSPCLYGRLALNSLHQGIFQLPGQHLEVPRVTSGGSRRRECPASAKKPTRSPTGAVCRSCITMPVSTGVSPTRRERRNAFPGSQVFGAGTLPVGFQGRSALVAPKGAKSPIQETCTRCNFWIFKIISRGGRLSPIRNRNGL